MIDLSPGQVFGPYQIVARLSNGTEVKFSRYHCVTTCCSMDLARTYEALCDNRREERTLCARCSKSAQGLARRLRNQSGQCLRVRPDEIMPANAWPRPASLRA